MQKKERVLSGIRPTGKMHLGNYLGATRNWVKLQDKYECFYMVADWHALTTGYADTTSLKRDVNDMVVDLLVCGLDYNKSIIFIQSRVKEHAELHLMFSMITPVSWLERCPTYKEQKQELKNKDLSTYGFLGYPLLQTADILVYKAEFVPVGDDQIPHVEMSREIARKFNNLYRDIFPEPQALLTKTPKLPGTDNRKMSKSYNNCIYLSDNLKVVKKKILGMFTDTLKIKRGDAGHPDECPVFAYHNMFNEEEVFEIEKNCKNGSLPCVECKNKLYHKLTPLFEDWQSKRMKICEKKDYIKDIINNGCNKANEVARTTMHEVKEAVFNYV